MKHVLPALICFFFLPFSGHASGDPFPIGARSLGLGNAVVTLRDAWSLFNNVGGLAGVVHPSAMASFSLQYNVVGLPVLALGVVLPTRYGNAALAVQRFGDELYSEQRAGLAYGHQIGNVSLGVKAEYLQIAASGLGSRGVLVLAFGGTVQLLPTLRFGAYGYNLNQAKISDFQDERVTTLIKAGVSYEPTPAVWLSAEVERDVDFPTVIKAGLGYEVVKNLYVRTGVSSEPFTNHFGVGIAARHFCFDYALTVHPQLGFSHHWSLQYSFERKPTNQATQPN